jgi:nicotinamidase-related amidase
MHRERSQLLIVDLQEKVTPAVQNAASVVEVCSRLVHIAGRLGVPVTVSQHYAKGLGPIVEPLRAALDALDEKAVTLDKVHFSCVSDEALHQRFDALRDHGRGQVVVAGIEAHVCVGQTVLDLIADGFEVYVAADGVSSRSGRSRLLSLKRIRQAGGYVVDSEMVMFEWLEKAGTPEFKELIGLLK